MRRLVIFVIVTGIMLNLFSFLFIYPIHKDVLKLRARVNQLQIDTYELEAKVDEKLRRF